MNGTDGPKVSCHTMENQQNAMTLILQYLDDVSLFRVKLAELELLVAQVIQVTRLVFSHIAVKAQVFTAVQNNQYHLMYLNIL